MRKRSANSVKLEWLQCARAFAAVYVATYHGSGRVADAFGTPAAWIHDTFQFGNAGVDLFFVISGFIIAHVHEGDIGRPERLKGYAFKRITRIYPLYWVVFLSVMPLYFLFPDAGEDFKRHWQNLVGCFFLIPVPPKQVIGVAWSLVFEMIFYIIFAVGILSRRGGIVLAVLWVAGIAAATALPFHPGPYIGTLLSSRFIGFFFGMAVAWLAPTIGNSRTGFGFLFIAFAAFAVFPFWFGVGDERGETGARIGLYAVGACIVWSTVNLDRLKVKAPKVLVRLGDATYSIYLFHWLVGWMYAKLLGHWKLETGMPPAAYFLSMTVLMIAGGYGAHLLLERPIMAISRDIWRDAAASHARWPLWTVSRKYLGEAATLKPLRARLVKLRR